MCLRSSYRLKISSGLLVDLHLMQAMRRSQDKDVPGFYIFADYTGTARSFSQLFQGWLILQTGSSFQLCMGDVSLSIVALCHAKNLPELETWFRDIIIGSRERGELDNSKLES